MAPIKMFLNLSACEEENTFLPSLKQVLMSTTLLYSKTVVYCTNKVTVLVIWQRKLKLKTKSQQRFLCHPMWS